MNKGPARSNPENRRTPTRTQRIIRDDGRKISAVDYAHYIAARFIPPVSSRRATTGGEGLTPCLPREESVTQEGNKRGEAERVMTTTGYDFDACKIYTRNNQRRRGSRGNRRFRAYGLFTVKQINFHLFHTLHILIFRFFPFSFRNPCPACDLFSTTPITRR